MTERHYDPTHLSTDEVKQIMIEVLNHWWAVLTGVADPTGLLYADPDELSEEYSFWSDELARRTGYDEKKAQDD